MDLQETVEKLRTDMPATRIEPSIPEAKTVDKSPPIFRIENVNFYYDDKRALKSIRRQRSSALRVAARRPFSAASTA